VGRDLDWIQQERRRSEPCPCCLRGRQTPGETDHVVAGVDLELLCQVLERVVELQP